MTVVAAKKYETKIVIAADSFCGSLFTVNKQVEACKLGQLNGVTFGAAGSLFEANLFLLFIKSHRPDSNSQISMLEFIIDFYAFCAKKGYSEKKNDFIICYEDKMFVTYNNAIHETKKFASIGAGWDVANTALYLGKDPIEAAKVACDLNPHCREPVNSITHEFN